MSANWRFELLDNNQGLAIVWDTTVGIFMNILVCVDLSQTTEKIVKKAEELAKAVSAKLWILHVAEPEPDFVGFDAGPQSVRDSLAENFHHEHLQIQAIADRMRKDSMDAVALLIQGSTAEAIVMEASKIGADMIIVGSHGKGMVSKLLLGSVSERVIDKAECPILIIPTHDRV